MTFPTLAHPRGTQQHAPGARRFSRSGAEPRRGFRAVARGTSQSDWAVIGPDGSELYRGYMLYAARIANELSRTVRA